MPLAPTIIMKDEFLPFEKDILKRFPQRKYGVKGEIVYSENARNQQIVFYVVRGLIDSVMLHETGRDSELILRGRGTIFPLFYRWKTTSTDEVLRMEALEDYELVAIPKYQLQILMLERPEIALAMIDTYGKFANSIEYSLQSRQYDPLEMRVADFLFMASEESNIIALSQEHLARFVGASRPKVNAVLVSLQSQGLIELKRGSTIVKSRKAILNLCSYTIQNCLTQPVTTYPNVKLRGGAKIERPQRSLSKIRHINTGITYYTIPCANIASASFLKPAMLAPAT